MYCVKIKHFADTLQYQIFEKSDKREVEDDFCEHSYLYEKTKGNKQLIHNPFNDDKMEWVTELKDSSNNLSSDSVRISRSRTIKKIYDIGRSNYWDWFLTFTFNRQKVDRYDFVQCAKKMKNWLDYLRERNPGLKYIVVPEQHKDGAWHFHGLFANMNEKEFVVSGKKTDDGKDVYNVGKYQLGWTEGVQLDGSFAVVSYLCKYVTKKLCEATKGKKRYWYSRNCDLPEVEEFEMNATLEDIIDQLDLSEARIVTKEGYVNVTYIDKPISIYSQNMDLWNRLVGIFLLLVFKFFSSTTHNRTFLHNHKLVLLSYGRYPS